MTTLHLHIPDDLEALLRDVEGGAEAFILETVRHQLQEKQARQLAEARLEEEYRLAAEDEKLLAKGYRAGHGEVRELMKEYKHVDLEGWEDEY